MKSKYITGQTQEAAQDAAAQFFGCSKKDIKFEVISGDNDSSWHLLAMVGSDDEIANKNTTFQLYYEHDGIYLELYENRGAGVELDNFEIIQHINRKNISGLNAGAVGELLSRKRGRMKIAPAGFEHIYGEDIEFQAAGDEMTAYATLLKPEEGGPLLSFESVMFKLRTTDITHGIDETAIKNLLINKDYGESKIIAQAILPKDGDDGRLIFHFSIDEKTGRPKEIANSGGRVDYRTLDLFEAVTEGQLIVSREPATVGEPGYTVKGNIIKQKPGKEAMMPRGKNVEINPEKTHMFAKCSGMVEYINNSINVSSIFKINGDCDMSVGNIDFEGSVHVMGTVRSGHTIKAAGSIVINGGVEAAKIIAGGSVEVKGGMQGGDRGLIEAGGTVTAMFIEGGTIRAGGSVTVDVCVKSDIESGGSLTAKGKRGAIVGGRVSVADNITASYIGSLSNVQTEVEVGALPRKRVRLKVLEKEQEKLAIEMDKLTQLKVYLSKSIGKIDQETWDKLYLSGEENRKINELKIAENKEELTEIRREIDNATQGKIHVLKNVYVGTRIIIGNDMYKVTEDIKYATFKYVNNEITYVTCEVSKS